jgi:adenylosuccinate lyase
MSISTRYLNPAFDFFSEQNILNAWRDIEVAILLARAAEHPENPEFKEAAEALASIGDVNVARKEEIEKETGHDLVAAIRAMAEQVDAKFPGKNYGRLIHQGVTSYDAEDSAMSLLLARAGKKMVASLRETADKLMAKADMFKYVPCNGFTHSQVAEPITVGKRFLDAAVGIHEQIDRFEKEIERINVCKIKGATGVYAGSLSPEFEERVAKILGQKVSKVATQILPIENNLDFFEPFEVIACKIENLTSNLAGQSGEPAEVKEGRKKGQTGSSTMTHKENPITLENDTGASRKIKALRSELAYSTRTPFERDISASFQVVRHIIPEMFQTTEHISIKMKSILDNLEAFPVQCLRNINKYGDFIFAGAAKDLIARISPNSDNKKIYSFVQTHSIDCKQSAQWRGKPKSLFDALAPEVQKLGGEKAVSELKLVMSLPYNLRNIRGVWRVATGENKSDGHVHHALVDYMISSGQLRHFLVKDTKKFIGTYEKIVRANYKVSHASKQDYADLRSAMSRLRVEHARLIKEKVIAA